MAGVVNLFLDSLAADVLPLCPDGRSGTTLCTAAAADGAAADDDDVVVVDDDEWSLSSSLTVLLRVSPLALSFA